MAVQGPIILVEDDQDDHLFIKNALDSLKVSNELKIFENGKVALDYLGATSDQPFLILCDINMPVMDGFQLRQQINDNPFLRQKSIPFVFLSTTDEMSQITLAYNMTIQGFFKKPTSVDELKTMLCQIVTYWQTCRHPNK